MAGITPDDDGKIVCTKCERSLNEKEFYTYKDGTKMDMCKKCLTMHVDNFDESTFLWILEKMDVPYIPSEWNSLRDKAYAKNPYSMNGLSVIGKYFSKMRLKQWKQYGWADSERLVEELEQKKKAENFEGIDESFEAEMKEQLEAGKITEAQYKTLVSTPTQNAELPLYGASNPDAAQSTYYDEKNFLTLEEIPDPAEGLTEEDKIYLAVKWGRLYKPNEWIELEKKYKEMQNFFGIDENDSDTIGTLIIICKTYLKMNQAIDCGDLDGFQKLSRVYDSMRKSAAFTAAQNKEKNNDFVGSVGELVAYCEREGGAIPKFKIDEPLDRVDKIIKDLKEYTKSLVYSDTTLAAQIEDYLKQRVILDQRKADRVDNNGEETPVSNEDYQDFLDMMHDASEKDQEGYKEI